VFDLGREDGRLFIAMEYVEGFDVNDLLRRCSRSKVPLPFGFAVHVVGEALKGLDYAHRRTDDAGRPLGIVHRDVSPSNVLVSFEGEVKVCDFGIAHANETLGEAHATHVDEALKGKAGYMSPEHARGEPLDARADVFAAGIILWELAAGRRLYRATEDGPTLLEQARRAEIPALPDRGLPMPAELAGILGRALAHDREARFPSAAAMQRELEAYAIRAKLATSPLQLGDWMTSTFGHEIVAQRRVRERAAAAIERGALVVLEPIPTGPASTPLHGRATERPPASERRPVVAGAAGAARAPGPPRAVTIAVLALLLVMAVAIAIVAIRIG
jgi:serine/threonine-protein kinase